METFFMLVTVAMALPSYAGPTNNLENFSPHLPANTPIVWQTATNSLPPNFQVYRGLLPRTFSATIISNAIVLGSLKSKGFPQPSTDDFIWDDKGPDYPGTIPAIFAIRPGDASIYYAIPNFNPGSETDIPSDEVIVKRAKGCTLQFGLDPAKLIQNIIYTYSYDDDENGGKVTRAC